MMLGGGGGGGDGGGASVATILGSSGTVTAHQEGGCDNLVSNNNNNTLDGVFREGENIINNTRNGNNMEDGDRNSAGSRWPRQETLALLKIRSDMDVAFRDSNLKGPLWDDVSRKMADLGYHRSAKKCKEKFENVYKYHKRTKDGRSSKSDGKTYRFFDQLEALDQLQPFQMLPPAPAQQQPVAHSKGMPFQLPPPAPQVLQTPTTISFGQQPCNNSNTNNSSNPITTAPVAKNPTNTISPKFQSGTTNVMASTSSSTSSDDFQQQRRSGKKRKWKDFFEKLMRDVVDKQEELQTKFLRTIEMRERERSVREEAWRMQEMARLNREHEILIQERSAAAAKDAAVITFLQKIAGQPAVVPETEPQSLQSQPKQQKTPHAIQQLIIPPAAPSHPPQPRPKQLNAMKPDHSNDQNKMMVCSSTTPPSSSRWPKTEVEALIKLRTNFEINYPENGPKGPFWEEISAGMRNLGYNRNAKRCKEKWENINKYFKKVKESNKQRPNDSKTCPYYHLLDAIYKEKKGFNGGYYNYIPPSSANSLMEPLMVQPEQQWPLAPQTLASSEAQNLNNEADDNEQDDMLDEDELDEDLEDEEEDDNNNGSGTCEVVATSSNKLQYGASATTGSMETAVA